MAHPGTEPWLESEWVQVFLEVDIMPRMDVIADALDHANTVAAHPLQFRLLRRGLTPGYRRYRRNFDHLYEFHKGAPASGESPEGPHRPACRRRGRHDIRAVYPALECSGRFTTICCTGAMHDPHRCVLPRHA